MEVAIADNADEQQFEITVDDKPAGVAAYRRKPGIIAFIHTEIDPEFAGEGLGSKLVSSALDSVAAESIDVLPFCPFVNKYIAEHRQYLPLVPEAMRPQFGLPDNN
jgi:predicted GNAT family acetyltransferase